MITTLLIYHMFYKSHTTNIWYVAWAIYCMITTLLIYHMFYESHTTNIWYVAWAIAVNSISRFCKNFMLHRQVLDHLGGLDYYPIYCFLLVFNLFLATWNYLFCLFYWITPNHNHFRIFFKNIWMLFSALTS